MANLGKTVYCLDAAQAGRFVEGVAGVAHSAYRRLTTPRETLRGGDEAAAYGLDLSAYLGEVGDLIAVAAIPGLIAGELGKDERIGAVKTTIGIEPSAGNSSSLLTVTVRAQTVDPEGSFALTLAVSEVTTELIGIESNG